MKTYPANSVLTIRQRIEKLAIIKRNNDPIVSLHNNSDGDGQVFWFYLSDWDSPHADFKEYKELDYRLDTESKSTKSLNLGFSGFREGLHDHR